MLLINEVQRRKILVNVLAAKHIITIQPGISAPQLQKMKDARITLVVPKRLHGKYPAEKPMKLVTLGDFVDSVKLKLA